MSEACLSVVVPALDAAATLPETLAALAAARADGLLREVLVVDGGSGDETVAVARRWTTRVLTAAASRGAQLAAGGAAATGDWLLFLHADTRLGPGWAAAARAFMARPGSERPGSKERAAAFRLALDDSDPRARRVERLANWR